LQQALGKAKLANAQFPAFTDASMSAFLLSPFLVGRASFGFQRRRLPRRFKCPSLLCRSFPRPPLPLPPRCALPLCPLRLQRLQRGCRKFPPCLPHIRFTGRKRAHLPRTLCCRMN
jgi:hypothetical protein